MLYRLDKMGIYHSRYRAALFLRQLPSEIFGHDQIVVRIWNLWKRASVLFDAATQFAQSTLTFAQYCQNCLDLLGLGSCAGWSIRRTHAATSCLNHGVAATIPPVAKWILDPGAFHGTDPADFPHRDLGGRCRSHES